MKHTKKLLLTALVLALLIGVVSAFAINVAAAGTYQWYLQSVVIVNSPANPWVYGNGVANTTAWYADAANIDNGYSEVSITIKAPADVDLVIDYGYNTGSKDVFTLKVDGVTEFATESTNTGVTGTGSYYLSVSANNTQTVVLTYDKDESGNAADEYVYFNLSVNGKKITSADQDDTYIAVPGQTAETLDLTPAIFAKGDKVFRTDDGAKNSTTARTLGAIVRYANFAGDVAYAEDVNYAPSYLNGGVSHTIANATAVDNCKAAGYTLTGWANAKDSLAVDYAFDAAGAFTEDTVLYPVYSLDAPTITMTAAGTVTKVDNLNWTATKVYDGKNYDHNIAVSHAAAGITFKVNSTTIVGNADLTGEVNVGSYTDLIDVTATDAAGRTWNGQVKFDYEITKKNVTVSFNDSAVYGAGAYNLINVNVWEDDRVTVDGLVDGEDKATVFATLVGTVHTAYDPAVVGARNVGDYITQLEVADPANYHVNVNTGKLTITPADLAIKIVGSVTYGEAYTYNSGWATKTGSYVYPEDSVSLVEIAFALVDANGDEYVQGTKFADFDGKYSFKYVDGTNDNANYTIVVDAASEINWVKRNLTVTFADTFTREYNGDVDANPAYTMNSYNDEAVEITFNAAFADKNASATAIAINVTDIKLVGDWADNYALTADAAATTGMITPKVITPAANGAIVNKQYDKTNAATILANFIKFETLVGTETLTYTYATATYAGVNVADSVDVTVTGITLGDGTGLASNYKLSTDTLVLGGKIQPRQVTLVKTAEKATKVYDGSVVYTGAVAAAAYEFSNIIAGDSLEFTYNNAYFNDETVALANLLIIKGLVLGGADAGNYELQNTEVELLGEITKRAITVAPKTIKNFAYGDAVPAPFDQDNEYYDITLDGASTLAPGQEITAFVLTTTYTEGNVAGSVYTVDVDTANVVIKSGADDVTANYTITSAPMTYSVAKRTLTITVDTSAIVEKTYDGNTDAALVAGTHYTIDNIYNSEAVTVTVVASYNNKNVLDANLVTISSVTLDGTWGDNYEIDSTYTKETKGQINPKTVTVAKGAVALTKVYDGTVDYIDAIVANDNYVISGTVAGEALVLDYTAAAFDTKNVTATTVTLDGIKLVDDTGLASNYTLAGVTTLDVDGEITAKKLVITLAYAKGETLQYGDAVDFADVSYTVDATDGLVAGDKITGMTYTTTYVQGTTKAGEKYHFNGETITIVDSFDADMSGNYDFVVTNFASPDYTLQKREITIDITNLTKTYGDADPAADGSTAVVYNLFGTDVVVISNVKYSRDDAETRVGEKVGAHAITFVSADVDDPNYTVVGFTNVEEITITKLAIVLGANDIVVADKIYDATLDATTDYDATYENIKGYLVSWEGTIDDVNVIVDAAFAMSSAAEQVNVSIYGITATGADCDNYDISTTQVKATAKISPRKIVVKGVKANNRNYDGTNVTTLDISELKFYMVDNDGNVSAVAGLYGTDDLTLGNAIATFADKNVAYASGYGSAPVAKAAVMSYSLIAKGSTAINNYQLDEAKTVFDTEATIYPAPIKVTTIKANDKTYDGTTDVILSIEYFGELIGTEKITVTAVDYKFDSKHAGEGKTVTVGEYVISASTIVGHENDYLNYAIDTANSNYATTANVNKRNIYITGIVVKDMIYNGDKVVPDENIDLTNLVYEVVGKDPTATLFGSDKLTVKVDGTFTSKDVQYDKEGNIIVQDVNLVVKLAPTADDAENYLNYNLVNVTQVVKAKVLPATITIYPDAGQEKSYGTVDPTFTYQWKVNDLAMNTPISSMQSGVLTPEVPVFTGAISRDAGEDVGFYAYIIHTLGIESDANEVFLAGNYRVELDDETVPAPKFEITPKVITIVADDQTKTYGDADPAFTFKSLTDLTIDWSTITNLSGKTNVETVVLNGAMLRSDNGETVLGGPYSIDLLGTVAVDEAASTDAKASNYVIVVDTVNTGDLTITPLEITISYTDSAVYNGTIQSFSDLAKATIDKVLPFNGSLVSVFFTLNNKNADVYDETMLTAAEALIVDDNNLVDSNANYTIKFDVEITITPATITINFADSAVYDGAAAEFTVDESAVTGLYNASTLTVTLTTTSKNVGIYDEHTTDFVESALVIGDGNDNYVIDWAASTITLEITPATITINFADSAVYDGAAAEFVVDENAVTGLYNDSTFSITLTTTSKNVGIYDEYTTDFVESALTIGDGVDNYVIDWANSTIALEITPATLTIDFADSAVYNGAAIAFVVDESAVTGLYNASTFSITLTTTSKNVGIYDEHTTDFVDSALAISDGVDNYVIDWAASTITLEITPATITINFADSAVYDGAAAEFTVYESAVTGLFNDSTFSITLTTTSKNVGIYDEHPAEFVDSALAIGDGNDNYVIDWAASTITLTITPAPLVLDLEGEAKYNGDKISFTFTDATKAVTLYNNSTFSITLLTNFKDVIVGGAYNVYDVTGTLENGFTMTALDIGDGVDNYYIDWANSTVVLTIIPADLVVTPHKDQNKVYGKDDPAYLDFDYKVEDLPVNTTYDADLAAFLNTLGREVGENVGNYLITLGKLKLTDNGTFLAKNYNLIFNEDAKVTFEIKKAKLLVIADDKTVIYGDVAPEYTYYIDGLVDNTVTDINGNVTVLDDTDETKIVDRNGVVARNGFYGVGTVVGFYADSIGYYKPNGDIIIISGNYEWTYATMDDNYIKADLTVNKKQLKLAIENAEVVYGQDKPTFVLVGLSDEMNNGYADGKVRDYGFVGTDSFESLTGYAEFKFTCVYGAGADVGTYDITNDTALATLSSKNYEIVPYSAIEEVKPGTLTVTPYVLHITPDASALNKVYGDLDPELTFTLPKFGAKYTVAGVEVQETVSYTGTIARAAGENAGTYAYVITGVKLTLNVTDGVEFFPGNYVVEIAKNANDDDLMFTIEKRVIKVDGVSADNKVYDKTTAATLNANTAWTITNICDGTVNTLTSIVDNITVTAVGNFADENAENGKAVTIVFTVSGDAKDNYTVELVTPVTADITPKPVKVSEIAALDKEYDQTTGVEFDLSGVKFDGIIDGDVLVAIVEGAFEDKTAGKNKLVNITSVTLDGEDMNNYYVESFQDKAYAEISPRGLLITGITAVGKVYDGSAEIAPGMFVYDKVSYTFLINGDDIGVVVTGAYADADAGEHKTITFATIGLTGNDAINYYILDGSQTAVEATITKAPLTVVVAGDEITYGDAAPVYTVADYLGFVNGETVDTEVAAGKFTVGTLSSVYAVGSKAGEYKIVAEGFDAKNYEITIVEGTLTVKKAALTVTVQNATVTYGDVPPVYAVDSITGFVNGEDVAVLEGDLVFYCAYAQYYNVGSYDILASGYTSDNYVITYVKGILTVNPATITITANDNTITYGDDAAANGYVVSGLLGADTEAVINGDVTYTFNYNKFDDATDVNGNAIEYVITPVVTGLSATNYVFVGVDAVLTVDKYELTADVIANGQNVLDVIYGAETPVYSLDLKNAIAGAPEDLAEIVAATTFDGIYEQQDGVGVYTVKATINHVNYTLTAADGTVNVSPKALTVTADDKTVTYGDAAPVYTVSYDGFTAWDSVSVLTGEVVYNCEYAAGTVVGTYVIDIQSSTLANANYDITYVNGEIEVEKKELIVTADNKTVVYGEAAPAFTVTIEGFVLGEQRADVINETNLAFANTYVVGDAAGTVTVITASGLEAQNYYFTYVDGTLTVAKRSIKIATNAKTITYGYEPQANGYTVVVEEGTFAVYGEDDLQITYLFLNNADEDYVIGSPITSDTVQYRIVPVVGNANYDLVAVDAGELKVIKRIVTVTVGNSTVEYGYDAVNGGYTAVDSILDFDLAKMNLVYTYKNAEGVDYVAGSARGEYTISITGFENDNYKFIIIPGTMTVTTRAITIVVEDNSIVYGEEAATAATPYTFKDGKGLFGTETLEGEAVYTFTAKDGTAYAVGSPVGEYTITLTGLYNDNYTITFETGILTVTKKALTITAIGTTINYADAAPALDSYTFTTEGLIDLDKETVTAAITAAIKYACDYAQGSNAGTYAVVPSGYTNGNYDITYVNGTLTVNKIGLTVTVNDQTKVYGQDKDAFTLSYSGFALDDTAADLDKTGLVFTCGFDFADAAKRNVGTYEITAAGLASVNYDITYVAGTLTVTKKDITITANDVTVIYGDVINYNGYTVSDDFAYGETEAVFDGKLVITSEYAPALGAGQYADYIVVSGYTSDNYNIIYVTGDLTVNKAELTFWGVIDDVAVAEGTKSLYNIFYGDAVKYHAEFNGFKNNDTYEDLGIIIAVYSEYGAGSKIGEYKIIVKYDSLETANYTVSEDMSKYDNNEYAVLNVNKRQITVNADNASVVYGNTPDAFTFTVGGMKLFYADSADSVVNVVLKSEAYGAGSPVNENGYEITIAVEVINNNYELTDSNGAVLTVTKRPLTVTPLEASKLYGTADPEFKFTWNADDLFNGEVPAFTGALTRVAGEEMGTYKFELGTLAFVDNIPFLANNYEIVFDADANVFTIANIKINSYGQSLAFSDEIFVNYYFQIDTYGDVTLASGGMMYWTAAEYAKLTSYTYDAAYANKLYIVKNNSSYNFKALGDGIAAKNYTDKVYARAYVIDGDGNYVYGDIIEYSVITYAQKAFAQTASKYDKLKTIMIELLDYGTATQIYFNHNTDALANAVVTAELRAMYGYEESTAGFDLEALKIYEQTNKKVNGAQNDLTWVGASVAFSEAFKINFYGAKGISFTPDEFGMIYWTAEQYAEAGETLDPTKATELKVYASSSGYKAIIDGIAAKNGDDVFYIAMYKVEADGTISYSTVKSCSIQIYATLAANRSDRPATEAIGKALLVYLAAAEKYFN